MHTTPKKISALAATLFAATLALAACSRDGNDGASSSTEGSVDSSATAGTTATDAANSEQDSPTLTLADGYCRAKASDSDMTACFGTLRNSSGEDITVESFAAPDLEDASTELHEVVDGMMRQKEGGFTIPAGGSQELAPGGEHLMVMNYPDPIEAGDTLTFTLSLSDGTEITTDFPVREQPSGEENYGDLDHAGHADSGEHGDHESPGENDENAESADNAEHSEHAAH